MTFKKYHIMPLLLNITPTTLTLPQTVPLVQKQQAIGGLLKWEVLEWNKAEYERMQRKVETTLASSSGVDLEVCVEKLAKSIAEMIPNREFTLQLSSFLIEHKPEIIKGGRK